MNIQKPLLYDLRRHILTVLAVESTYELDHIVIGNILEQNGKATSADCLINQLLWLQEQGFVDIEKRDIRYIAMLTERGLDVARGRARAYGVRDLLPSEIKNKE